MESERIYKGKGRWIITFSVALVIFISFFVLVVGGCNNKKAEEKGIETEIQTTNFKGVDDAAKRVFGSLSVSPISSILTGRIITGRITTGQIITGRMMAGRIFSPGLNAEDDAVNIFGRLNNRLSKKQSDGFGGLLSCEDIKPECVEGEIEKLECKITPTNSGGRVDFEIKLSNCKEIIDEEHFVVSTGYAKGYVEILTKPSSGGLLEVNIITYTDAESLIRDFSGGEEKSRVRTKAKGYKTEFSFGMILLGQASTLTPKDISGGADEEMKVSLKVSGEYSVEDEIGKKKEEYLYKDFSVELKGHFQGSGEQRSSEDLYLYWNINGVFSVDTDPESCVEGVFSYRTIKPIGIKIIDSEEQQDCGIGELEVNNSRIEFLDSKVKVTLGDQSKEYSCDELDLCKYEPIKIPEFEQGIGGGEGGVECPVWYKDVDGDGYTDGITQVSCEQPLGYVSVVLDGNDCNDGEEDVNPGAQEICDGKDNNCNNQIDEGNVCVFTAPKVSAGCKHTCQ